MTKYRNKTLIEAYQWFKNGDHPDDKVGEKSVDWGKLGDLRPDLLNGLQPIAVEDIPEEANYERIEGALVRFFRHPDPIFAGDNIDPNCGFTWHEHGWIDERETGLTVCPGSWVVSGLYGGHEIIRNDIFEATFEKTPEPLDPIDLKKPHSHACNLVRHNHGPDCSTNCPTCGGK